MSKNILVFGGSEHIFENGIIGAKCVAISIEMSSEIIFMYCPLFEVSRDSTTAIGTGQCIAVIPKLQRYVETCFSLLSASGVRLAVEAKSVEEFISGIPEIEFSDSDVLGGYSCFVPELRLQFQTTAGLLSIKSLEAGALVLSVDSTEL